MDTEEMLLKFEALAEKMKETTDLGVMLEYMWQAESLLRDFSRKVVETIKEVEKLEDE